jgi:DUF4097 and DUF4098 domain-containing protein YvlB
VRKLTLLVSSLLLASLSLSADEWNKSFKVSGKPELRIDARDGSVEVNSWDQKEIQIHVETVGWRIAADEVRITDRQIGDRVEMELLIPTHRWGFSMGHRSIRIDVKVPRELKLDLRTGDGSIRSTNLRGDLQLSSGDGAIRGLELEGDLRIHTGDGSIELSGIDGNLSANTGDGNVTVSGRFDVLDLRTGDGSIRAAAERGSKISDGWSFNTGDGSVDVRLPGDFSADLDARTGDGSIDADFPVLMSGSIRRDHMHGKLNAGGPPLHIRTGDGSIRLSRF